LPAEREVRYRSRARTRPQSAKYDTGLERERLLPLEEVRAAALNAKQNGASRFCMGAAWRNPTDKNLDRVIEMISLVKDLGMESCVTLGMLTREQTRKLKTAGLDYYNHNLDTSPEYYEQIITTRTYQDRLDTLENLRAEDINVCCGGIVGMGETDKDRAALLQQLANLPEHPQSVPINLLVQVENTPLYGTEELDPIEFVRTIAVARIMMPASVVRLSAGRTAMSEELQALCFLAGANSIFYGDTLLTTPNPEENRDRSGSRPITKPPELARIAHRFPTADAAKRTVTRRTPVGPLNVAKLRRRGPLVRAARHSVFATPSRRKAVSDAGYCIFGRPRSMVTPASSNSSVRRCE